MKIWVYVAAAVLFVLLLIGAAIIGDQHGSHSASAACGKTEAAQAQAIADAKTDAAHSAAAAQKKLDDEALAEEKAASAKATAAVAAAQAAQAAAEAKNASLTNDYARLKANDQDIQKWGASCLPAGILSSLHGPGYKAGVSCR